MSATVAEHRAGPAAYTSIPSLFEMLISPRPANFLDGSINSPVFHLTLRLHLGCPSVSMADFGERQRLAGGALDNKTYSDYYLLIFIQLIKC